MIASPTWQKMGTEIQRDLDRGIPWRQIHQLHIAVDMSTQEPYKYYRERLAAELWPKLEMPPTIIEVGAGYGAMGPYWPAGATVWNVDIAPMLEIQRRYHAELPASAQTVYMPIDQLPEKLPQAWEGAYLFSVWALTETTREMWQWWIENADKLAGAYVLGYRQWTDETESWPWDELADKFKTGTVRPDSHFPPCDALELIAFNR